MQHGIPFVTLGLNAGKWKIGIDRNSCEVESAAGSVTNAREWENKGKHFFVLTKPFHNS